MSTRSIIAYPVDNRPTRHKPKVLPAFTGTYHHSDGYPKGVGRIIWALVNAVDGDAERIRRVLVDENPGGWSLLHVWHPLWGDTTKFLTWDGTKDTVESHRERLYAIQATTGTYPKDEFPVSFDIDPQRKADLVEEDGPWMGAQYIYVMYPDHMAIFKNDYDHGWYLQANVRWDTEPDWEAFTD